MLGGDVSCSYSWRAVYIPAGPAPITAKDSLEKRDRRNRRVICIKSLCKNTQCHQNWEEGQPYDTQALHVKDHNYLSTTSSHFTASIWTGRILRKLLWVTNVLVAQRTKFSVSIITKLVKSHVKLALEMDLIKCFENCANNMLKRSKLLPWNKNRQESVSA